MEKFHQSRVPDVLGATISLTLLASVAVGARFLARKLSAARIWWDDYILLVALVLNWGLSTCYWLEVRYCGLGRHTVAAGGPVTPKQIQLYYHIFMPLQVIYFASAVTIKTSLILLYYRIFSVIRWFRWLLAMAGIIVVLFFTVCVFVAIFECKPVRFYWDKTIPGGKCIDENSFYRWNGVANLLIDFMIWSLTLPVIWHLNMSIRQKFSLSFVFALGLLACAASIVRVVAFNWVDFEDVTYTLVPASVWTTIEQTVGIICACLPTIRPLWHNLFSKLRESTKGSSKTYTSNKSRSIPLTDQRPSFQGEGIDFDNSRTAFAKLEGEDDGMSAIRADLEARAGPNANVSANATKVPSDGLLVVPERIVQKQELELRVDKRI